MIPGLDTKSFSALEKRPTSEVTSQDLPVGSQSTFNTCFNILKLFLGVSCLVFPATFKSVGIYGGIGGLLIGVVLNTYLMSLQIIAKESVPFRIMSYGELAEVAFGPSGKNFIDFILLITHFFFCVGSIAGFGEQIE